MSKKLSTNFMIGILLGGLAALLYWYWQKSTTAEDGALDLLDRLAEAEAKFRKLTTDLRTQPQPPAPAADDLETVRGVGPVFAERLQQAGISSIGQMAATSVDQLAQILQIRVGRAENILAEARALAG